MKVVIATNNPGLDSPVAKRFGHALYYLLVDTTHPETPQVIENSEAHDESHAIISHLVNLGGELFVTGNIGPHAFELIQSLKGRVALARHLSANEALDRLELGELEILSAPTVNRSLHNHTHHTA